MTNAIVVDEPIGRPRAGGALSARQAPRKESRVLLQLHQVSLGKGRIERGQHLAFFHHVPDPNTNFADNRFIKRRDINGPAHRFNAPGTRDHPIKVDYRDQDHGNDEHDGEHIEDEMLALGGRARKDGKSLRLEGTHQRADRVLSSSLISCSHHGGLSTFLGFDDRKRPVLRSFDVAILLIPKMLINIAAFEELLVGANVVNLAALKDQDSGGFYKHGESM